MTPPNSGVVKDSALYELTVMACLLPLCCWMGISPSRANQGQTNEQIELLSFEVLQMSARARVLIDRVFFPCDVYIQSRNSTQ